MAELHGGRMRQGYLAMLVCMVGISFSPLFYKLGYLTGLNAFWLNVFRILFAEAVMVLIVFLNQKRRRAIFSTSRRSFWISALGGTLLALHLNSWALALVYTDSYAASTIIGSYVLLTVMFSALILKERTSKSALSGLIVVTAGVVVCNLGGGFGRLGGNLLAVFSAVCEALYVLCGRKAREDTDAVSYTTILYAFTLFWMLVMALLAGIPQSIASEGILWAGMLAVFTTLLGHSMASVALKHFKAASVSALMMTGVVTGPLLVMMFLSDTPTPFTAVGGTIILLGLAWYMLMERREKKTAAQAVAEIARSPAE